MTMKKMTMAAKVTATMTMKATLSTLLTIALEQQQCPPVGPLTSDTHTAMRTHQEQHTLFVLR
tara:strand:- start:53 stop:241 length:189 start_codon:yes stop_codon:yes gene_type:complete